MSKLQSHSGLTTGSIFRHLILRRHAERYVLISLLSFALAVSLTRFFLNMTGFPQLGSGKVHISHVLWGGLLLFASVLLLISFINQKIFTLSAVIGGVGIGLFIDEVGKFITSDYDYFIPVAAPIIYSFFLLTVLIYLLVYKRAKRDSRQELYQLIGDLEEILDNDFTQSDIKRLYERIESVEQNPNLSDLSPVARSLRTYLDGKASLSKTPLFSPSERVLKLWSSFRERLLPRRRVKSIIIGGLLGFSLWELIYPLTFLLQLGSVEQLLTGLTPLVTNAIITGPVTTFLFILRLSFNLVLGVLLVISAIFFLFNQEQRASSFSYLTLLVLLTSENLLLFYFDQFSTIINASLQLILLLFIIYYRKRYLQIRI